MSGRVHGAGRFFAFFLILFGFVIPTHAQTVVQGTVTERDTQKPLPGINVTIQEPGSAAMVAYTMTDDKGTYRLEYKGARDSIIVSASGFNVSKETKTVINRSQVVDFVTSSQAIAINEVRVAPQNIRMVGDTLKFSVAGYIDQSDRTIADVIRKLPGVEIRDDGRIFYNNLPINRYYIEDMDLLGGRYGIANNNIRAQDVSEVQVLENHQPIKVLQEIEFSENAAINLKLKESAKGVLTANTLLGAGAGYDTGNDSGHDSDLLWLGELVAMYFTRNMQNITTYKGNNSGDDVSRDLQILIGALGSAGGGAQSWLSIQSPPTPAVSQNRSLRNQVHTFSFNNAWKLAKDYQLNVNTNYTNDRQDRSSYSRTENLLHDNSLLIIEEQLSSRLYKNQGSADITLNANTKQFYFNNAFTLRGAWDSESGNALTSADDIYQRLDRPNYSISNAFRMTKSYSKTILTISSNNSYASTTNNLQIEPMMYDFLFDPIVANAMGLKQGLLLNNFSSSNSLSFGFVHGRWNQSYSVGFNANLQHLTTELQPALISGTPLSTPPTPWHIPDSLQNDLRWNRYEWRVQPTYTYQYGRFKVTLGLPLQFVMLQKSDYFPATKDFTNRLLFSPSLNIAYKLSPYWDATGSAAFQNSLDDINNAYTGYIMRSYRNLQRNESKLSEQQIQIYRINLSYRNPIYALFGNMSATYSNRYANLLLGYDYNGILRVQTTIDMPNTTESISLNAGLSKGFDAIASTLSVNGSYTSSRASQFNQGALMHSNNQRYSVNGNINTRIQRWAGISYNLTYSQSQSRVEDIATRFAPMESYSQQAQLNLFPVKNLTVTLSWEHFYTNAIVSGSRYMSFGDISLRYKWPKVEALLNYTNIFNTKEYISASYSDVSAYYYAYSLRPAEIMLKFRFKIL